MSENKFTGMRLAPEFLERIAIYEERYGWTPGQLFVQLLDFYDRMKQKTADFGQGVMNDGEQIVFHRPELNGDRGFVDFVRGDQAQAVLYWLIGELGETNMADSFVEYCPDFEDIPE